MLISQCNLFSEIIVRHVLTFQYVKPDVNLQLLFPSSIDCHWSLSRNVACVWNLCSDDPGVNSEPTVGNAKLCFIQSALFAVFGKYMSSFSSPTPKRGSWLCWRQIAMVFALTCGLVHHYANITSRASLGNENPNVKSPSCWNRSSVVQAPRFSHAAEAGFQEADTSCRALASNLKTWSRFACKMQIP